MHDQDTHDVHDIESAPNMHEQKSLEMNVHESVPHEDQKSDLTSANQNTVQSQTTVQSSTTFNPIEPDKTGPGRLGDFDFGSDYTKLAWILIIGRNGVWEKE